MSQNEEKKNCRNVVHFLNYIRLLHKTHDWGFNEFMKSSLGFNFSRMYDTEVCLRHTLLQKAHSITYINHITYEGGLKSFRPQHEDSSTRK